jgi:hypothetical protein
MIKAQDFNSLIEQIRTLHDGLKQQAYQSVNVLLTIRNWMIGYYISEYELKGTDRAVYGDRLIDNISIELKTQKVARTDREVLYRYCKFYKTYPDIMVTLSSQLPLLSFINKEFIISRKDILNDKEHLNRKVTTVSSQFNVEVKQLVERLSFSHFIELINIDDGVKRAFYEFECLQGNWSVRQ